MDTEAKQVTARGELAFRLLKNYARLEEKEYRPESMFQLDGGGWPGDLEGRAILALVLLWQRTGREPAYLRAILQALETQLAARGYLGACTETPNEQQLSGHGWLLRGLAELYAWKREPAVKAMMQGIVRALFLPVADAYARYPLDAASRSYDGEAIGTLQDKIVNGWMLSTDIGCAFIPMDGLSRYYELFREPEVGRMLEGMADAFLRIDFLGASLQTHASLTAARGLLRLYECTGREAYLRFCIELFELYTSRGMTENYANYNWFGRPEWTEPCGIVDSYMVAMALYAHTGECAYLETANRILYSGLYPAQRSNGGFGCDTCVTAEGEHGLRAHSQALYEAYWCCTMRGAEGLSAALDSAVLRTSADSLTFTNYVSGDYRFPGIAFTVDSDFPERGEVVVQVTACDAPVTFAFYLPQTAETARFALNGEALRPTLREGLYRVTIHTPCVLRCAFPLPLVSCPARTDGDYTTLWQGYRMFGRRGDAQVAVDDSLYRTREALVEQATDVLFYTHTK